MLDCKNLYVYFLFISVLITACHTPNSTPEAMETFNKQPSFASSISEIVSVLDSHLTVIYQDSKNNYWLQAKDKSILKYDGEAATRFTEKDGLCNLSILAMQEDQLGNIYFDTPTCVSKYDGQQFSTLEVLENLPVKNTWILAPDDLWFRMGWDKSGPYRYDGKFLYHLEFPKSHLEDEFNTKYPNSSYNPYGIYSMYKDSKGHLWFGTTSFGICHFDGKSACWLYEEQLTKTSSGGDFGIRSIIEDNDGYFWFCNSRYRFEILLDPRLENGSSQLNYTKENGVGYTNEDGEIEFPYFLSVAEDQAGDIWMVTYRNGVWRNNGKELLHYPIQENGETVFLSSIYIDNFGNLWINSHHNGAYKYNGKTFAPFRLNIQ